MSKSPSPKNFLKIILGLVLCALVAVALLFGLDMVKQTQDQRSNASVQGGVVKLALSQVSGQAVIGQPVKIQVILNTNQALIDGVQLGIRVSGSAVQNPQFLVQSNSQLKMVGNETVNDGRMVILNGGDASIHPSPVPSSVPQASGMNVLFITNSNTPSSVPQGTVLGDITFTPVTTGQVQIYFDPSFSKVTTHSFAMPGLPGETRTIATVTNGGGTVPNPSSTPWPTARPSIMPSTPPQPSGSAMPNYQVTDLLATPPSLTINVMDVVRPSSTPTPTPPGAVCTTNAQCGLGRSCINGVCRPNPSPTPTPPACTTNAQCGFGLVCLKGVCRAQIYAEADLNKDGVVNVLDLSILVKNLLQRTSVGDLNKDGIVDLTDYSIMLSQLR